MKVIGIFTNSQKDPGYVFTEVLIRNLAEMGATVIVPEAVIGLIGFSHASVKPGNIPEGSDIVICLGGDGTFLKTARMAYKTGIPILGINLGRIGFLTDIDKNDIKTAAKCVISNDYKLEERMMLDLEITRDGEIIGNDTALNDVVISRGALSRIIHVKTFINDTFVDVFPGDGLIVSSPTGSTAYSLSAGGPIVVPDTEIIIITPICPHILYTRSFVTDSSRVIRAIVEEDCEHEAMVTVDGQKGYEIRGGDVITIRNSRHRTKLIKCGSNNFFSILRNKIYYRGEDFGK